MKFAIPLQGSMGKKYNVSTVISVFLKGLNNCKLAVNQTLLWVGNAVLCQKVFDE